jgi:hypothetical protein
MMTKIVDLIVINNPKASCKRLKVTCNGCILLISTSVWRFLHCSSYNFYSSLPSLSSPIIPTIPHQPHGSYHLVFPCHVDHHRHCHLNILSLLVKPIWDIPQTKKLHVNPFFYQGCSDSRCMTNSCLILGCHFRILTWQTYSKSSTIFTFIHEYVINWLSSILLFSCPTYLVFALFF